MPTRPPVRRKGRRPGRPSPRPGLSQTQVAADDSVSQGPEGAVATRREGATIADRSASSARAVAAARAAELAQQEVTFLRHDLRNVLGIAGLMLVIIVALTFVLH